MGSDFDLIKHFRDVSDYLFSQYRLSSAYKHKSGRGDIRENILANYLKEILPDSIGITKGEILESNGKKSPEFDIILYARGSNTLRLYSTPNRKVIPIEEVLAVIEIKSHLKKKYIADFLSSIKGIDSFNRYYKETQQYTTIKKIVGDISEPFSQPIPASQGTKGIGRILGHIFAYESSSSKTVGDYIKKFNAKDCYTSILVLNKALWMPDVTNNKWYQFTGKDAFFLFIYNLLETCRNDQRWGHVVPDFKRYIDQAASAADIVKKKSKKEI